MILPPPVAGPLSTFSRIMNPVQSPPMNWTFLSPFLDPVEGWELLLGESLCLAFSQDSEYFIPVLRAFEVRRMWLLPSGPVAGASGLEASDQEGKITRG